MTEKIEAFSEKTQSVLINGKWIKCSNAVINFLKSSNGRGKLIANISHDPFTKEIVRIDLKDAYARNETSASINSPLSKDTSPLSHPIPGSQNQKFQNRQYSNAEARRCSCLKSALEFFALTKNEKADTNAIISQARAFENYVLGNDKKESEQ